MNLVYFRMKGEDLRIGNYLIVNVNNKSLYSLSWPQKKASHSFNSLSLKQLPQKTQLIHSTFCVQSGRARKSACAMALPRLASGLIAVSYEHRGEDSFRDHLGIVRKSENEVTCIAVAVRTKSQPT